MVATFSQTEQKMLTFYYCLLPYFIFEIITLSYYADFWMQDFSWLHLAIANLARED
jgi:hypothetical protein